MSEEENLLIISDDKKINSRDISLISLPSGQVLVVACDSSGGIGPLKNDHVNVPGEIVGRFLARVPLMEIMSVGAKPIGLIDTLSVAHEPVGRTILAGIKEELREADLENDIFLNGSTEENIPTSQTGAGLTVIGITSKNKIRSGNSKPGDLVVAVGLPRVGNEVIESLDIIADIKSLRRINSCTGVHEVIAVGSKGINYESKVLADMSGLKLRQSGSCQIPLDKSCGPATVLLVAVAAPSVDLLKKMTSKPVNIIGRLEKDE